MQTDQKINVNNISLSIRDSGTGNDPVVFVHPFPFDKTVWEAQFDFLKKTNRVISFDVRGFGKSTSDTRKSSVPLFADDLIAMLDTLGLTKVIGCGLSMGGYILLNAVERYPERFKAIILGDTQCLADSKGEQQNRYDTISDIEKNGLETFSEKFLNKALSPYTLEHHSGIFQKLKAIILSNQVPAITSGLSAMAQREQTCSDLRQLKIPALVVSGKEDVVIQPSQSEFLFNNIAGSQLQFIEHAGHLSNVEQPDLFNKIIYQFIDGLTK